MRWYNFVIMVPTLFMVGRMFFMLIETDEVKAKYGVMTLFIVSLLVSLFTWSFWW